MMSWLVYKTVKSAAYWCQRAAVYGVLELKKLSNQAAVHGLRELAE